MEDNTLIQYLQIYSADLLAVVVFLVCFRGYIAYTARKSLTKPSLAFALHRYRRRWVRKTMIRENRIADTNIIGNHERNIAFFASSSLLILAGLFTILGSADTVTMMLADIPFTQESSRAQWEAKIVLLIFLFVYAFFKFTWALRQFDMASVMIGGSPETSEQPTRELMERYVEVIARMLSKAGGNFNNGLRTYYFSMTVLGWFVSPWLFIGLTVLTVAVLYRREYNSDTLEILMIELPSD